MPKEHFKYFTWLLWETVVISNNEGRDGTNPISVSGLILMSFIHPVSSRRRQSTSPIHITYGSLSWTVNILHGN